MASEIIQNLGHTKIIYRFRKYLFDIWYFSWYGYPVDDYGIHDSICLYYCIENEETIDNTQ